MAVTVLIVDDEKLIRAGIRKILTDDISAELDLHEARNGEEALEWCRNNPTQLVITDIRMPKMDGVDLMKNLNMMDAPPSIIVLSGFDEFSYAKAAISYGAISYILKPVDRKELVEAVKGAIENSRNNDKARAETQLQAIVKDGTITDPEALPLSFISEGFLCLQIAGKDPEFVLTHAFADRNYYLLEKRQNMLTVVISAMNDVEKRIIETASGKGRCVAGVSGVSNNISNLRALQRQASLALLYSYFEERPKMVYLFHGDSDSGDMATLDMRYETSIARIDTLSLDEMKKAVGQWFHFPREATIEQKAIMLSYLYTKVTSNLLKRYTEYTDSDGYLTTKGIMIANIWRCESLTEWEYMITDYVIYLSALIQQETSEVPFIREALKFVREHYREEITMTMVANHVSSNYTWFSEKFVEQTGMHFNDYLKRIRVVEAKKLLSNQCLKVYEVAEQCGFPDTKYFIKVFRNETGMTPTEYRRSLLSTL